MDVQTQEEAYPRLSQDIQIHAYAESHVLYFPGCQLIFTHLQRQFHGVRSQAPLLRFCHHLDLRQYAYLQVSCHFCCLYFLPQLDPYLSEDWKEIW